IDYCHNVDGMRQLADFVNRMMVESPARSGRVKVPSNGTRTGRAIGVLGIPGDRRDEDQREYGAIAAGAFDEIVVREDANLRGRAPGETASNVIEGIRGARATGDHARNEIRTIGTRRIPPAGPARSGPPRAALQPRDELGQLRADVDRPRPERSEEVEYPVAILVAHQDDDPRAVRAPAV